MKKIMVVLFCAMLMVSAIAIIFPTNTSAYITHDPIYIDGNANFTAANGVTGGTGTQTNPYIIEGWNISAFSANGIEIRNTDVYFIIRNCHVYDGKYNHHDGICFYNVQNGRIENTISSNNYYGISPYYSSYNNIFNNSVNSNNGAGIYLSSSSNDNNIFNNSVNSNNDYGISLCDSSNNTIFNNSVNSNTNHGIRLYYSSNNTIFNNSANSNNYDGIHLGPSSNNNNIFNNSASNNDDGISLYYSSNNNNIFNNSVNSNNYGIYLYFGSNNNILSNNSINLNNEYGIYLDSSSNDNNIFNNSVNSNNYGIYLYFGSNNNILSNNSINLNNEYGIYLEFYSSYNIFAFNNISYNNRGVEIYESNCKNTTFHHNNFINGSVVNVIDNGANTKWDDGSGEGNYWSNYTGADDGSGGRTVGDGVGDTNIPHMGLDNYPLMEPVGRRNMPPVISSVNVSDVTANSVTITWLTDENSDSRVNYSVNADLSSNSTQYNSTMTTSHSITLTDLSQNTTYYFEVSSTDSYGNTATDTNNSNYYRFTTLEDTNPPVISSVEVSNIADNSATITWITNENSDSTVNYSINADLSSNSTQYNSTMTTSHSITLTGLSPGITYYFEVSSTDSSGNTVTDTNNSNYYKLTTTDTTPPVISSVSVSDITANSATITWITDENSDSRVNYSVNSDLSSNFTKYDWIMTTIHSITLTGLNPGTTYYFEASSTDNFGNTATDTNNSNYYRFITLEGDTTPPIISSVAVSGITENSATITWTTDENSDSRVNYSVNSDLSSNLTKYNSTMTTTHSITLTDLNPETTYYFEVSSTDNYGNTATDDNNSHYYTFTTEKPTTAALGFIISEYLWVILLVIIIIVIVVIVAISRKRKGKEPVEQSEDFKISETTPEQSSESEETTEEIPPS